MCSYALFTHCSFERNKRKYFDWGEDPTRKFFANLKGQATEKISSERNRMLPLTNEGKKAYQKQKFVTFSKKDFIDEFPHDEDN